MIRCIYEIKLNKTTISLELRKTKNESNHLTKEKKQKQQQELTSKEISSK